LLQILILFGIQNVEETLTEMIVVHFVSPFRAKLDIEFKNTLKCRRDKVRTAYQKLMENSSIYGKLNLEDSEIEKLPVDGVPDCLLSQIINTGDLEFDELHSSRYSKELNDLKEGMEFEDEDDTILERSGLMDSKLELPHFWGQGRLSPIVPLSTFQKFVLWPVVAVLCEFHHYIWLWLCCVNSHLLIIS
jgi:hypothetical protein